MEKLVLLSLGLFALTACNNPENSSSETDEQNTTESAAVGGDKDEHGCLIAAGETWSELKQGCVQIFNIGQRLNPIAVTDGEAVISAFVLLNDDKSKLEVFLPDEAETIILDKDDDETYQKDSLKFDAAASALYINSERAYKAE